MSSENEFPTIRDLRDGLSRLVEYGLGDLPVQVVIVPNSTMQAVARATAGPGYDGSKPALMIELEGPAGIERLPVSILSAEYVTGMRTQ